MLVRENSTYLVEFSLLRFRRISVKLYLVCKALFGLEKRETGGVGGED